MVEIPSLNLKDSYTSDVSSHLIFGVRKLRIFFFVYGGFRSPRFIYEVLHTPPSRHSLSSQNSQDQLQGEEMGRGGGTGGTGKTRKRETEMIMGSGTSRRKTTPQSFRTREGVFQVEVVGNRNKEERNNPRDGRWKCRGCGDEVGGWSDSN